MPPSLPWFFVVSLCPGSFPWGCSVVPSTRSLGHFLASHCSCCREQLGWDGVPLSSSSLVPDFLTLFVQMYCHWAVRIICLSGFLCTHLLFLVLAMMSILLGFVLNRMSSRNPRKQHTVVCCIHGTSGDVLPWIFFSSQFTIHFYMLTYSGDPII